MNVLLTVLSAGALCAVVAFYRATRHPGAAHGEMNVTSATHGFRRTEFINVIQDETGQDLIEYALVGALIALGAVVSMKSLSTRIASAFASVGTDLTSAV